MRLELVVIEGRYQGVIFPLDPAKPSLEIGRMPGVDILLDDPRVSRRHARLLYSDGKLRIADLGSRNGIIVNGRLYPGKAQPDGSPSPSSEIPLKEGDTLRIKSGGAHPSHRPLPLSNELLLERPLPPLPAIREVRRRMRARRRSPSFLRFQGILSNLRSAMGGWGRSS